MVLYCPHCGHTKFMAYRHGDQLMCRACGAVVDPGIRCASRLKLETPRIIVAAVWLSARFGNFTRSELAKHLGVSYSPMLRDILHSLAERGILAERVGLHPQNGSPTLFYSRPTVKNTLPAAKPADRPFWGPGAVA